MADFPLKSKPLGGKTFGKMSAVYFKSVDCTPEAYQRIMSVHSDVNTAIKMMLADGRMERDFTIRKRKGMNPLLSLKGQQE